MISYFIFVVFYYHNHLNIRWLWFIYEYEINGLILKIWRNLRDFRK